MQSISDVRQALADEERSASALPGCENLLDGEPCLLSAAARPHISLAAARLRNLFRCPSQRNVEQCSPSLRDRTCSASAKSPGRLTASPACANVTLVLPRIAHPEPPRDSRRTTHHPFFGYQVRRYGGCLRAHFFHPRAGKRYITSGG
jgi:hypothetical protein